MLVSGDDLVMRQGITNVDEVVDFVSDAGSADFCNLFSQATVRCSCGAVQRSCQVLLVVEKNLKGRGHE